MHTITRRPLNDHERRVLERPKRADFASWASLMLAFGLIPIVLLGRLGTRAGRLASDKLVVYACWTGWVAGFGIFVWAGTKFILQAQRRRAREKKDAVEQMVQEIVISNPRVLEMVLIKDQMPMLAFDMGNQRILFLQGQWLREPEIYGVPHHEMDRNEEPQRGLPKCFRFPNNAFTLTRLPHSGRVLSIRVHGDFLAPEKKVMPSRREYEFGDSELLDGSLDDLGEILARAHARRSGTSW